MPESERPVVRLTGSSALGGAEVLSAGREPPSRPPWRWREHRRLAAGLLAVGLGAAAVGAAVHAASEGGDPAPAAAPSAPPSTRTPQRDLPPTPGPGARLTTTVSVGHVRLAGRSVSAQLSALSEAMQSAGIRATIAYSPDPFFAPRGSRDPVGVEVAFDRSLSGRDRRAYERAVAALHPSQRRLGERVVMSVDLSVPLRDDSPCAPGASQGGTIVLPQRDLATVGALLPSFGLVSATTRATLHYTGLPRTRAELRQVGEVLARACGAPPGSVAVVPHPLPGA